MLPAAPVLATSLAGQVAAAPGHTRRAAAQHYNVNGGTEASRVTGVAWLSPALGIFAAGHATGALLIYQKRVGLLICALFARVWMLWIVP